jgi:hypothetical protein
VIDRPHRSVRGTRIDELDRVLARDPEAIAARFERAGLLREQGLFEPAKRDYLEPPADRFRSPQRLRHARSQGRLS